MNKALTDVKQTISAVAKYFRFTKETLKTHARHLYSLPPTKEIFLIRK